MADVNVFELTNMALKNLDTPKSTDKKSVKESVKRSTVNKKRRSFKENKNLPKISYKKLKLESAKCINEDDDFDFTPDDEVVLVIDTEMEEVPETEEDAVVAAQELVGDKVCKCSVCGANYICTDDVIEEDVDGEVTMVAEEGVCPICGEEAAQIVVGEIVADTDAETDSDETDAEETDAEETDVEETDVEVDDTDFDIEDDDIEETDVETESFRRRAQIRRESAKRPVRKNKTLRKEAARKPMKKPMRTLRTMESATTPSRVRRPVRPNTALNKRTTLENRRLRRTNRPVKTCNFNESALNKLFTTFAKENYSNVKAVKFTKGSSNNGRLTLEGVVTTIRGNKRSIKLVAEGFNKTTGNKMVLKAREIGPFTESAIKTKGRVPFVIECVKRGNMITPVSMKYAFTTKNAGLKESQNVGTYKVFGSVK